MKYLKTVFAFIFAFALSINFASAQWGGKKVKGNNQVIEETRTLSPYTEIEVSGSFQVELIKGATGKITIVAESNLVEHILTKVDNGNLTIKIAKKMSLESHEKIRILVPFDELKEISMSGSGAISSEKTIEATNFRITQSGSGKVNLQVAVSKELSVTKSGSGQIQLKGNAKALGLNSSGSGKFEGEELFLKDANIDLSGSGSVLINVKEEIITKVSGSGKVIYIGNPATIDTKISGSGKVEKL